MINISKQRALLRMQMNQTETLKMTDQSHNFYQNSSVLQNIKDTYEKSIKTQQKSSVKKVTFMI
jgi:uncharacterized protein YjaZ